jgi:EAL domain-containing protein (putative c-di-GMP-specific phosphodiesterase class I)
MEALIRLRESDGSFISPGEFIPIAEKTGLITPITKFVLHESCRVLRDNPWLDNIRASINLSISNLVDERFVDNINQIVDSYGIPHYRISFEFTERVLIEHLDEAKKNMQRLTESGYTFYLDDFGVGYSNFNCVLQLPLRTVKLDMSLTSSSAMENDDYGLVGILTDLFHNMGLKVVAEGAETDEQVETLIKYGVDGIQGYYFAKPMSINRLRDFLSKQKSES